MHSCWVPFGTMRACIAVSRKFIEFRSRHTHTPTQSQSRSRSRSSTNIDCAYKCKWKVLLVLVNHIFLFVNIFFCHFKSASSFVLFFRIEKPFLHTNTPIAYKNTHTITLTQYNAEKYVRYFLCYSIIIVYSCVVS